MTEAGPMIKENRKAWALQLHRRLLEGDPLAPAELAEALLDVLVRRLRIKVQFVPDNSLFDDAAADAILAYVQQPAKFNPTKSSLLTYLTMSAHGDLLNMLAREQRQRKKRQEVPLEYVEYDVTDRNNWVESVEDTIIDQYGVRFGRGDSKVGIERVPYSAGPSTCQLDAPWRTKNLGLQRCVSEKGYPKMMLSHLLDVAGLFLDVVSKSQSQEEPRLRNEAFRNQQERVKQKVKSVKSDSETSWRALLARLWRLHRLNVFDVPEAIPLDYTAMLKPGRVSIIDLSDTDSPLVNNLVIAQLLRGVQHQQDKLYLDAITVGKSPLQTMIFIEEAHEFLSRERIKNMQVLFEQVARIARRGRKRWLGLAFITQLPQQLPDEVLGLINNWVLHKIGDSNVVNRLRRSIGDIDDSLWNRLPALAPGQAVASFTSLARPLLVTIDPTPSKLKMVE